MSKKIEEYELLSHLKNTADRLCLLEKLSGIGYAEMDILKRQIHCSDQLYAMLGYDTEKLRRLKMSDLMHAKDYDLFLKKVKKMYHDKQPIFFDAQIKTADNAWKFCRFRFAYCCIDWQKIFAGTVQDLDEIITANKELEKAKKKAEKSNHEKSYFLAQASHDLRQPMQAQSLYLDMFPTDSLTAEQKKIFLKIKQSSENLKHLLNSFLDLSRLDYGAVSKNTAWANMGLLLSNLGKEFADVAEYHGVDFEYSICSTCIETDAFLVERVVRNLLSNAFKFARKKVGLYCQETPEFIKISITDDGKGVDPEDLEHIFEAFYRGKNTAESKIEGAGLGLAIVKSIAQILNIRINVDSNVNQGTCFYFKLNRN